MTKEQVLEKLMFDVELRGLSKHTQDEYYTKCKIFQNHFDKPATELNEKDIREFLHFLTTEKKLASGSVNSYNSGLRFLYGVTLNTNLNNKYLVTVDIVNSPIFLLKKKFKASLMPVII